MPPRTVNAPVTVILRGWHAATRSSRILLVTPSRGGLRYPPFHLGSVAQPFARAAATYAFDRRAPARRQAMADARRMGKMELFAHFAEKFDMKRTQVRDLFEELLRLSEK